MFIQLRYRWTWVNLAIRKPNPGKIKIIKSIRKLSHGIEWNRIKNPCKYESLNINQSINQPLRDALWPNRNPTTSVCFKLGLKKGLQFADEFFKAFFIRKFKLFTTLAITIFKKLGQKMSWKKPKNCIKQLYLYSLLREQGVQCLLCTPCLWNSADSSKNVHPVGWGRSF